MELLLSQSPRHSHCYHYVAAAAVPRRRFGPALPQDVLLDFRAAMCRSTLSIRLSFMILADIHVPCAAAVPSERKFEYF